MSSAFLTKPGRSFTDGSSCPHVHECASFFTRNAQCIANLSHAGLCRKRHEISRLGQRQPEKVIQTPNARAYHVPGSRSFAIQMDANASQSPPLCFGHSRAVCCFQGERSVHLLAFVPESMNRNQRAVRQLHDNNVPVNVSHMADSTIDNADIFCRFLVIRIAIPS